jgi:hypothetical protein
MMLYAAIYPVGQHVYPQLLAGAATKGTGRATSPALSWEERMRTGLIGATTLSLISLISAPGLRAQSRQEIGLAVGGRAR